MLYQFLASVIKLALASLITGVVLSRLNMSADEVLARIGLTPAKLMELLAKGALWALPNLILGSMFVLPIWLVIYLLRPPRNYGGDS